MVKIISKITWVAFAFCFFSINALADVKSDVYCELGAGCTFHPHDEIAMMGAINQGKTESGKGIYDGQLKNGEYTCHIIQKNAIYRTSLHIGDRNYFPCDDYTFYLAAGEKYEKDVKFQLGRFTNRDHNYLVFILTAFPSIDPKTEVTVNCKEL